MCINERVNIAITTLTAKQQIINGARSPCTRIRRHVKKVQIKTNIKQKNEKLKKDKHNTKHFFTTLKKRTIQQ